jgi:glycerol-3-phosphate cytidylyltransferase-like family protein
LPRSCARPAAAWCRRTARSTCCISGTCVHLEAARKLGDVLIVTITADHFVNKGPGRPVFTAALRAEMLATLEYVDWVAINDSADAVSAINRIRPGVYVKGPGLPEPAGRHHRQDHARARGSRGGGGRIQFTDEVMYSSTELINRHINVFEPHVREHLDGLRRDGGLAELIELIERVRDYRVLLVGDAIIDEYQYVLPMGKTPKENMIATRYQDRELVRRRRVRGRQPRGVVLRAGRRDHLSRRGREPRGAGAASLRPNVRLRTFTRAGAPTTLKRRFVDPSRMGKLFEVYHMNDEPLTDDVQGGVDPRHRGNRAGYDLVIAADFGHGLIAPSSIAALTGNCPLPRRQCAEQQRQSRLQSDHQVSARRLCLHRRAGGAARGQRPGRPGRRHRSPPHRGAHRMPQDHRHPGQARLRHL